MAEPFIGEIKMFAGNFAPQSYALCNGQVLSISQNTALFAVIGTFYGGNGQTTFALPNLQGRAPMFWGQGPGLSNHVIGEMSGANSVTLLTTQMPSHTHSLNCNADANGGGSPQSNTFTGGERGGVDVYATQAPTIAMNPQGVGQNGGSIPHNNMQPYLGLTFIIALQGIFPPRN